MPLTNWTLRCAYMLVLVTLLGCTHSGDMEPNRAEQSNRAESAEGEEISEIMNAKQLMDQLVEYRRFKELSVDCHVDFLLRITSLLF